MQELADLIAQILQEKGSSHVKVIAQAIIDQGGMAGDLQTVNDAVYAAIINEINRNKEGARFVRSGRAMFVLTANYDPEEHVFKGHKTKRSEDRKYERKTKLVPTEERRCGNCKFLAFYGVHFWKQRGGHCNNDDNSGRPYVKVEEAACDHWRQRSADQVAADRREQQHDLISIHVGGSRKKKDDKKKR